MQIAADVGPSDERRQRSRGRGFDFTSALAQFGLDVCQSYTGVERLFRGKRLSRELALPDLGDVLGATRGLEQRRTIAAAVDDAKFNCGVARFPCDAPPRPAEKRGPSSRRWLQRRDSRHP